MPRLTATEYKNLQKRNIVGSRIIKNLAAHSNKARAVIATDTTNGKTFEYRSMRELALAMGLAVSAVSKYTKAGKLIGKYHVEYKKTPDTTRE